MKGNSIKGIKGRNVPEKLIFYQTHRHVKQATKESVQKLFTKMFLFDRLLSCSVAAVTLTLAAASVIPAVQQDTLLREARQTTTCSVDGRVILNGANFTRMAYPCAIYQCVQGTIITISGGCFSNGGCHSVGDIQDQGCFQRTCTENAGRFEYVVTSEGCLAPDGVTCISVNGTWNNGCFIYQCQKEEIPPFSVSYATSRIQWGCELDGQCYPENYTMTTDCEVAQCQRRGTYVGFYSIQEGCKIGSECVEVGHSLVDSCRTLTCERINLNGFQFLNVRQSLIQCQDADNECHDSGSFFPLEVNGLRVNCTCTVIDTTVGYSC